jgi:circadian clock protein KaiC
MERVKTGIPGFDELIEGGIPKGFNVLLVGQPGTGKTIFGLQYLINGAMEGHNGLYVSLDSPAERVKEQAKQFGWDVNGLEKAGKLSFLKIPLDKPKVNLFDMMEEEIEETKAERVVFDSLADFAINIDQFVTPLSFTGPAPLEDDDSKEAMKKDKRYRYEVMPTLGQDPKGRLFYRGHSDRRISYLVLKELAELGTTNLIITDAVQNGEHLTVDGVSEYVCDGLISVTSLAVGDTLSRNLETKKMRSTKIDGGVKSYEIDSKGITILKV